MKPFLFFLSYLPNQIWKIMNCSMLSEALYGNIKFLVLNKSGFSEKVAIRRRSFPFPNHNHHSPWHLNPHFSKNI